MSTADDWSTRLHAAVDEHPRALAFDPSAYVDAGRRRVRRLRVAALSAAAAVLVAATAAMAAVGTPGGTPEPAEPVVPDSSELGRSGPNGWLAVDRAGGEIYLLGSGKEPLRLELPGSEVSDDACPAWSPDGGRLLVGRVIGSSGTAQLVVVPIGKDGSAGEPDVIELDGFDVLPGFDPHPCGTWAPDGRWVALAGTGEVWLVDTQTGDIRRVPDLRPSDLEWRPGTDELAIAGDMGADRGEPTVSTPVSIYSVSTGELRQLGAVEAAHLTWSPDGSVLAYTGGETGGSELRLVDADGGDDRVLGDVGENLHGIGPVWSPAGDRIMFQRVGNLSGERHEVVLVDVADGTETVIPPPSTEGRLWYPYAVTWSPDGEVLAYDAWTDSGSGQSGVITVPADSPSGMTVLLDGSSPGPGVYSHQWNPVQMWGRRPG